MTDPRVTEALKLAKEIRNARPHRGTGPQGASTFEEAEGALESHLAAAFAKCDVDYAAMRELVVNGGTEIAHLTAELESSNAMCASLSVTVKDLTNAVAATIAAHMAELGEARKDAGRLDYILAEAPLRCLAEIGIRNDSRESVDAAIAESAAMAAAMTKEKP